MFEVVERGVKKCLPRDGLWIAWG